MTRFNLFNLLGSTPRPFARSVAHLRRHEINQVMRNASALLKRNFRSRNLNLTIDLNGITVDNLAVELQSHLNAKLAFTGSGRADDGDDGFE